MVSSGDDGLILYIDDQRPINLLELVAKNRSKLKKLGFPALETPLIVLLGSESGFNFQAVYNQSIPN
jgi:hypothetical protein